jgi:hypothetical protein
MVTKPPEFFLQGEKLRSVVKEWLVSYKHPIGIRSELQPLFIFSLQRLQAYSGYEFVRCPGEAN